MHWLFVQRLVVLSNFVDNIFNTIITTLMHFILWEILMFVDTFRISTFFQFLCDPETTCSPLESKFPTFSIFTFIVSQQYLNTDVNIIWCWRFIMALIMTLLFLFVSLYVFTGLSMYIFSNDIRRGQHSVKDVLVKGIVKIRIFYRW